MALSDQEFAKLQELLGKRSQRGSVTATDFTQPVATQAVGQQSNQGNGLAKAAGITDTIFGGGKVGDALGTWYAKHFSEGGKALKKQLEQGQITQEQFDQAFQGPSAKEIAGSTARAGLMFAPVGRIAGGLTKGLSAAKVPLAKFIGNVGAGAMTGAGFDIAEDVENNRDVKLGAGTAIGAGVPAVFGAAQGLAKATPKLLSYTSDVPEEAFKQMIQRRDPVTKAIKAGTTAEDALKSTQSAVRGLRKTMTQEWDDATKQIFDEFSGKRMGLNSKEARLLDQVADDFPIDIPDTIENMSVKESLDLLKSINELYSKRAVREAAQGISVRKLKESLQSKVIKTFGGDNGSVSNLYKNYSAKKGVLDAANDIVKAYSIGKPIQQSTALGRLKALFNENKSAYLDAILDLEKATGKDILSKITAVQFADKMPKGTKALTSSGTLQQSKGVLDKAIDLLILPMSSPRSAGFISRVMSKLDDAAIKTPGDAVFGGKVGNAIEDSFEKSITDAGVGMSIKKTVSPASVAKKIDKEDFKKITRILDDISGAKLDPDMNRLLNDMGLGKATSDELRRFLKDVIDEFEGVANRVVK